MLALEGLQQGNKAIEVALPKFGIKCSCRVLTLYRWVYIMLTCFLLDIMQPRGHDRLSLWLAP